MLIAPLPIASKIQLVSGDWWGDSRIGRLGQNSNAQKSGPGWTKPGPYL